MPIYEFYCPECHTVFSFFSRRVNTDARPHCPKCPRAHLERQVSRFTAGKAGRVGEDDAADADLSVDESRMERAVEALASEAESMGDDDPRQAARLMRKFSKMTGVEFGDGMETALSRMEAGEDPEKIEEEMGDALEGEGDPFVTPGGGGGRTKARARRALIRDSTLYEM